jgi:DNA-binding MarR family transcriptional regulator
MPHPVSDLPDHIGYWLRFVSNHVSGGFAKRLAAHDIGIAEWVMLRHLFDGPGLPPSELADRLGVTRGAITKLAGRLIARSLISRKAAPDDGRAQTLALTAKGRALLPRLAALADQNDKAFFGHLSAADKKVLLGILNGVIERHGLSAPPIE